jgi:hypothetical protein
MITTMSMPWNPLADFVKQPNQPLEVYSKSGHFFPVRGIWRIDFRDAASDCKFGNPPFIKQVMHGYRARQDPAVQIERPDE